MLHADGEDVVGYVRADGARLVNGEGKDIVLRGVGFGSWMLPEGYMWRLPSGGDRPRRIEKMIERLIGPEKATEFWTIYYDKYIAEADIKKIAEEGFNSIRIAINASFLYEDRTMKAYNNTHLALLDRVIAWCEHYRIYVVLDLHGAPGGQTGANIDDSEKDLPELFMHDHNKKLTVDLWRMLAERYKDEWIVAGYDLLNEPLPEWFATYNDQVMPLYRDIVSAIREVDDRHMIILEGVHWSTDWSIFEEEFADGERFDDNMMLQFHKYWNNPDTESIAKYIEARERWQMPIYMGEGGENNINWYSGAFRMFDDHRISWNFWTWKKIGTTNSPCSIHEPNDWQLLVQYLEGGEKPSAAVAERILWEYLDNIVFENCEYHADVVNAMMNRVPVRIPAVFYGYHGEGVSYSIERSVVNKVGFRVADGTDIRFVESERTTATFEHGGGQQWTLDQWLCLSMSAGEWFVYEFEVADDMTLKNDVTSLNLGRHISMRLKALNGAGKLAIEIDGEHFGEIVLDDDRWITYTLPAPLQLANGMHRLTLKSHGEPLLLQWIDLGTEDRE